MIQPNYTEKALVPYTDTAYSAFKAEPDALLRKKFISLSFFKSRYVGYLFFLSVFILLSATTNFVMLKDAHYANKALKTFLLCFSSHSFFAFLFTTGNLWIVFHRAFCFFAGFTSYSLPVVTVIGLKALYANHFTFRAVMMHTAYLDFYAVLGIIAAFSLQLVFDICFFTECIKFKGNINSPGEGKRAVNFCIFSVYLCFVLVLEYFKLSLSTSLINHLL